jgi:hypothetical protein
VGVAAGDFAAGGDFPDLHYSANRRDHHASVRREDRRGGHLILARAEHANDLACGRAPQTYPADLFRDVLPNVGPDWGVCVLPPADGATYPQVIAALAVKAGSGPERVDEALLKAPQILADLYNIKNPAAPIRVDTVKQGKLIVKVLVHDGLFPAGVRPACAVKDGFLLLASSPEAIARFALHDTAAPIKGEAPLLRVSPLALGQFLKHRRAEVLLDLQKKNQLTLPEAERNLDQLLGLLDLFESITFSQRSEPGQASWVLRVQPRMKP